MIVGRSYHIKLINNYDEEGNAQGLGEDNVFLGLPIIFEASLELAICRVNNQNCNICLCGT